MTNDVMTTLWDLWLNIWDKYRQIVAFLNTEIVKINGVSYSILMIICGAGLTAYITYTIAKYLI